MKHRYGSQDKLKSHRTFDLHQKSKRKIHEIYLSICKLLRSRYLLGKNVCSSHPILRRVLQEYKTRALITPRPGLRLASHVQKVLIFKPHRKSQSL